MNEKIVKDYMNSNISILALANKYNTNWSKVNKILKDNNIPLRNNKSLLCRKYNIDDSYFDKIDTEEKAYFLGFLYADGTNNGKNSIVLSLQEKDKEILEKLNKCINSNRPLGFRKSIYINRQNSYVLHITNIRLSQNLTRLGVIQNKRYVLKFPTSDQIPENLLRHFIRGMFDGDGHFGTHNIYKNNKTYKQYDLDITSTYDFCLKLKEIIDRNLNIESKIYNPKPKLNKPSRTWKINSKFQIILFLDWLYKDATIYLDRKYKKYLKERSVL